jgi:hypothetical protein
VTEAVISQSQVLRREGLIDASPAPVPDISAG